MQFQIQNGACYFYRKDKYVHAWDQRGKNHVPAMVSTLMEYETQTLNFTLQTHDLQLNQLHVTSTWHLCKATGEDHRKLVLLNGATDTGVSSTISLS